MRSIVCSSLGAELIIVNYFSLESTPVQGAMPVEGRTMAPPASVKTTRPKLFRRASLTSWGKDNLRMTRAAADTNIRELMLAVQQQKVGHGESDFAKRLSVLYMQCFDCFIASSRTSNTEAAS